jgi:hypothetical protein
MNKPGIAMDKSGFTTQTNGRRYEGHFCSLPDSDMAKTAIGPGSIFNSEYTPESLARETLAAILAANRDRLRRT